jgi:hypothetical protein
MWFIRGVLVVLVLISARATRAQSDGGTAAPPSIKAAAAFDEAENEKAIRFLEGIQRQMYLSLRRNPPVYDDDFLERTITSYLESRSMTPEEKKAFRESMTKVARDTKLRSKYEDLMGYLIIESLDTQIRTVIRTQGLKLPGAPVFGTLPTRQVNARTFEVPGSSKVIIAFEDQAFMFALLFTKAVAYTLPGSSDPAGGDRFATATDRIRERIDSDPEPLKRFQEVLFAYLVEGAPGAAPQYFQRDPYARASEALRQSLELFMLGHEYGHFIANHLAEGRRVKAAIGKENVAEIVRSWTDEFEADAYGLLLSVLAMRRQGFDVSLSYWGADFFFTMPDVVERAVHVLATGNDGDPGRHDAASNSHPPPALRREALREAMRATMKEGAEDPIKLAEALQFSAELLWERTKPAVRSARAAGIRPHPSWRVTAP